MLGLENLCGDGRVRNRVHKYTAARRYYVSLFERHIASMGGSIQNRVIPDTPVVIIPFFIRWGCLSIDTVF